MPPNHISRRSALAIGGLLVSLGVGASAFTFASADETPGADGFTAKTVPAGSDSLVLVDTEGATQSETAKAVTRTLLDARQFDDLPEALVGAVTDESQSSIDVERIGKVVAVGSNATENSGGVVVWADWTDEELVTVFESRVETDARTDSYKGRTLHTTGETSAVRLGETEFALGSTTVVRSIVDVWHGDAKPVEEGTLDSFERTPRRASVRFSFDELLLPCDSVMASRPDVYDAITQVYGSVSPTEGVVRLHLRTESGDASNAVATALRADLGITGAFDREDATIPYETVEDLTVEDEHDFVTVEYDPTADEITTSVHSIIETITCLIGRSG